MGSRLRAFRFEAERSRAMNCAAWRPEGPDVRDRLSVSVPSPDDEGRVRLTDGSLRGRGDPSSLPGHGARTRLRGRSAAMLWPAGCAGVCPVVRRRT